MERKLLLILIVVALMAIATRSFLYNWENIFGIDSYWFARHSRYVLINGDLPERDPLYSYNFYHPTIPKELSFYLPAWYYQLRFGGEYNTSQWFTVLKDLSMFFGVVGSISSALIGFTVGGPLGGLLGGTLAATNPGYVYRSMAGFYEDDAVGLALFLLGMWLFIEAVKRRSWKYGILSGVAWLGVAVSWKAYELVVYTIVLSVALIVGREIVAWISQRIKVDWKVGALLTVVSSLLIWIVFRFMAIETAIKTIQTVGSLTTNINGVGAATLLILGTNPLIVILMGLMAYFLTLYLLEGEKKYIIASAAALLFSAPFYFISGTVGFQMTLNVDGRDVIIGYGEAFKSVGGNVPGVDLYQMFFGSFIIVFVAQVAASYIALMTKREENSWKDVSTAVGVGVLVLAIGLLAYFYNGYLWTDDFFGGTPPILEQRYGVIGATVVEERYGYFFWAPKFSILALFVVFAAPFLIYKRRTDLLILLAVFGLTLYLAWIKLKTNYYFGAPLGIVAGVILADMWQRIPRKEVSVALYMLIVLSLLATGIFHTVGRVPTLLTPTEVAEAQTIAPITADQLWIQGPDHLGVFSFIEQNTEKNATIFNWWGIGHWLAFFTERYIATDNTNIVYKANEYVAKAYISHYEEGIRMVKEKNYHYILWRQDYIFNLPTFLIYAYGFEGARQLIPAYSFFITEECKPVEGVNYYNCGSPTNPLLVEKNIVEDAPILTEAPINFEELPKFRNLGVYKYFNRLILVSENVNNSFAFLLFTGGNEDVKPVYVSPRGVFVLFEVS